MGCNVPHDVPHDVAFEAPTDHGDAIVLNAQQWLNEHFTAAAPVEEIGWRVGYEDPAFFRRLFKRITHMPPGAYRRKFRLPAFAATGGFGPLSKNTLSGNVPKRHKEP